MKFCQDHWDKLRQLLKDKNMFHLVATSGEALVSRLQKEVKVPDPLFEAHMMLLQRSMEIMGMRIMGVDESGNPYCPMCEARKTLAPHPVTNLPCDESWMTTLIDHLYDEYKKDGFLNNN